MTNTLTALACALLIADGVAFAQEREDPPDQYGATQPDEAPSATQSAIAAPTEAPPAPPLFPPLPPESEAQAEEQVVAPATDGTKASGQWFYTEYYGWVFVPYGDQYVSLATDFDPVAYAYVYRLGGGWAWLAAPWLGADPYLIIGSVQPSQVGWHRGPSHGGRGQGAHPGGGPGGPSPGPHAGPYQRPRGPAPTHDSPGQRPRGPAPTHGSPGQRPQAPAPTHGSPGQHGPSGIATGRPVAGPSAQGLSGRGQGGTASGGHARDHH